LFKDPQKIISVLETNLLVAQKWQKQGTPYGTMSFLVTNLFPWTEAEEERLLCMYLAAKITVNSLSDEQLEEVKNTGKLAAYPSFTCSEKKMKRIHREVELRKLESQEVSEIGRESFTEIWNNAQAIVSGEEQPPVKKFQVQPRYIDTGDWKKVIPLLRVEGDSTGEMKEIVERMVTATQGNCARIALVKDGEAYNMFPVHAPPHFRLGQVTVCSQEDKEKMTNAALTGRDLATINQHAYFPLSYTQETFPTVKITDQRGNFVKSMTGRLPPGIALIQAQKEMQELIFKSVSIDSFMFQPHTIRWNDFVANPRCLFPLNVVGGPEWTMALEERKQKRKALVLYLMENCHIVSVLPMRPLLDVVTMGSIPELELLHLELGEYFKSPCMGDPTGELARIGYEAQQSMRIFDKDREKVIRDREFLVSNTREGDRAFRTLLSQSTSSQISEIIYCVSQYGTDIVCVLSHFLRMIKETVTSNRVLMDVDMHKDKEVGKKGLRVPLIRSLGEQTSIDSFFGDVKILQVVNKSFKELTQTEMATSTKAIYFLIKGDYGPLQVRLSEHIPYAHYSSYTELETFDFERLTGEGSVKLQKRFLPDMDLTGWTLFRLNMTEGNGTRRLVSTGVLWVTFFNDERVVGLRRFYHHRSQVQQRSVEKLQVLAVERSYQMTLYSDISSMVGGLFTLNDSLGCPPWKGLK